MTDINIVSGFVTNGQSDTQPPAMVALDGSTALHIWGQRTVTGPQGLNGNGIYVARTVNKGASWTQVAATVFGPGQAGQDVGGLGVWYDKWTPNLTALNEVHTCHNRGLPAGTNGLRYRRFNASTLALSSEFLVSSSLLPSNGNHLYLVRTITNHLYVVAVVGTSVVRSVNVYKSDTNGNTWSNVYTSAGQFPDGLPGVNAQSFAIVPHPGNNLGFWLFVFPNNDDSIHHYSWEGGAFHATVGQLDTGLTTVDRPMLAATIRHTDLGVFVAYVTSSTDANAILRVVKANGLNNYQPLADVLQGTTGNGVFMPQLMCAQSLGSLYLGYMRGTMGTQLDPKWTSSINSGLSWATPQAFHASPSGACQRLQMPVSTPGSGIGMLNMAWYDPSGGNNIRSSDNLAFPIGGYTVRSVNDGGPAQIPVNCATGEPV